MERENLRAHPKSPSCFLRAAGLTPLPESLCLVIQLCVVEGELGLAAEVFDLPASQTSPKPWVTYCTALFGSDAADLGYSMLLQVGG